MKFTRLIKIMGKGCLWVFAAYLLLHLCFTESLGIFESTAIFFIIGFICNMDCRDPEVEEEEIIPGPY